MRKTTKILATALTLLLALPLFLVVVILSPIYFWVFNLLSRWGVLPQSRSVDLVGDDVELHWSYRREDAAGEALASAVSLLVELIPHSSLGVLVTSLRFENPEAGMVLAPECLQTLTADFGPAAARLLQGNHVEQGRIVVNGTHRLETLNLDARSPLAGHLSVELPGAKPGLLAALASRYDFQLGSTLPPRNAARGVS